MKRFKQWWRRLLTVRVVMERAQEIPEEELLAQFAGAPSQGLWKAMMQVLDKKIVACSDAAFDEQATDAELRVASGGGKALLELKADLLDYVQRGRQQEMKER